MQEYNKALVAFIMSALVLLEDLFGWTFGFVTEQGIIAILAILTPLLVWLIPNRSA